MAILFRSTVAAQQRWRPLLTALMPGQRPASRASAARRKTG